MLSEQEILTVDEACAILKVSRKTIYNLINSGDLAAVKVVRGWRIMNSTLEKYLKGENRSEGDEDRAAEKID